MTENEVCFDNELADYFFKSVKERKWEGKGWKRERKNKEKERKRKIERKDEQERK